MFFYR